MLELRGGDGCGDHSSSGLASADEGQSSGVGGCADSSGKISEEEHWRLCQDSHLSLEQETEAILPKKRAHDGVRRMRRREWLSLAGIREVALEVVNGWALLTTGMGDYGTNYDARTGVAVIGLGANLVADAFYPISHWRGWRWTAR